MSKLQTHVLNKAKRFKNSPKSPNLLQMNDKYWRQVNITYDGGFMHPVNASS
jgi:hypothetical protein